MSFSQLALQATCHRKEIRPQHHLDLHLPCGDGHGKKCWEVRRQESEGVGGEAEVGDVGERLHHDEQLFLLCGQW